MNSRAIDRFEKYILRSKPHTLKINSTGRNFTKDDIENLCEFLEVHPEINEVDLSNCWIKNDHVIILARITTIAKLDLHWNWIGDHGAIALAGNPYFKELNLACSFKTMSDKTAKAFAENKTLEVLDLTSCFGANGNSAAVILAKNNTLRVLTLRANTIYSSGAMAFIKNDTLVELNLIYRWDEDSSDDDLQAHDNSIDYNVLVMICEKIDKNSEKVIPYTLFMMFKQGSQDNNSSLIALKCLPEIINYIFGLMDKLPLTENSIQFKIINSSISFFKFDSRIDNLSKEIDDHISDCELAIWREERSDYFVFDWKVKRLEEKIAVLEAAKLVLYGRISAEKLREKEEIYTGWNDGIFQVITDDKTKGLVEQVKKIKNIPLNWDDYKPCIQNTNMIMK